MGLLLCLLEDNAGTELLAELLKLELALHTLLVLACENGLASSLVAQYDKILLCHK